MAEPLPPPGPVGPPDPLEGQYALRLMRSVSVALNHPAILASNIWRDVEADAAKAGGYNNALLKVFKDLGVNPQQIADILTGGANSTIAWVLTMVTGLNFTEGQISDLTTGLTDEVKRRRLGQILTDLYAETLKTEKPAAGWLARNPGEAELENFRQLSGAAMRLSLSTILVNWAGEALPLGLAKGLKDIAEKINDAVALDDALEEVVQVPMQAVIQRGLEAKYNRELLPQDYTESEVRQLKLRDKVTDDVYKKVLDNQGVRLDIRQPLLDLAAPNLTESDLDQCYQHNLLSRDEIKEQYHQKGFQEPERELKTKLVEGTRRWKLEEKVFELYGNLYRDGIATKDEVRPFLQHFGYDPDEIDLWMQAQELERRQRKWLSAGTLWDAVLAKKITRQQAIDYLILQGMTPDDAALELDTNRKWLTNGELKDMLDAGLANVEWVIDYDVNQGMLPEDAQLRWMSYLLARYKRELPPDCKKILTDAFSLPNLLTKLFEQLPEIGIGGLFGKTELRKIIDCLIAQQQTP